MSRKKTKTGPGKTQGTHKIKHENQNPNRDIHGTDLENEQHQQFTLMTYSCFAVMDEEDINLHLHLEIFFKSGYI